MLRGSIRSALKAANVPWNSGSVQEMNRIRVFHPSFISIPLRSVSTTTLPAYKSVDSDDIRAFRSMLSDPLQVLTQSEDVEMYNRDWTGEFKGKCPVVLLPRNTKEVSSILSYCYENHIPIVPQGGNTGLVGGGVGIGEEVVLSLSKLNKIHSFDENTGVLICDAGCILENLQTYLADRNHVMPVDLGARGSCHIGGLVATNAGGINFCRYGSLHTNTLGLEVVLPRHRKAESTVKKEKTNAFSSISNILHANISPILPKNNTGFHLKHFFIGSEGSLGVITRVALQTFPKDNCSSTLMLAAKSFEGVRRTCESVWKYLRSPKGSNSRLNGFEFFDRNGLELWTHRHQKYEETRQFLENPQAQQFILLELTGNDSESLSSAIETLSELCLSDANLDVTTSPTINGTETIPTNNEANITAESDNILCVDGVVAQSEEEGRKLWAYREGISEALNSSGHTFKFDLSVPQKHMYTLVEETRQRLNAFTPVQGQTLNLSRAPSLSLSPSGVKLPPVFVTGYGHVADYNLHLNVLVPFEQPEDLAHRVHDHIVPWIYERVSAYGGSISAEHGLGQLKSEYVSLSQSAVALATMMDVKRAMDPRMILQPKKLFPWSEYRRSKS